MKFKTNSLLGYKAITLLASHLKTIAHFEDHFFLNLKVYPKKSNCLPSSSSLNILVFKGEKNRPHSSKKALIAGITYQVIICLLLTNTMKESMYLTIPKPNLILVLVPSAKCI